MVIVTRVEEQLPLSPIFHQTQGPEESQLVGYGRLRQPQCFGKVRDGTLPLRQEVQDANARRIRQRFKRKRGALRDFEWQ